MALGSSWASFLAGLSICGDLLLVITLIWSQRRANGVVDAILLVAWQVYLVKLLLDVDVGVEHDGSLILLESLLSNHLKISVETWSRSRACSATCVVLSFGLVVKVGPELQRLCLYHHLIVLLNQGRPKVQGQHILIIPTSVGLSFTFRLLDLLQIHVGKIVVQCLKKSVRGVA